MTSTVSFRLDDEEMRELQAEARRRGLSANEVARDWMRCWSRVSEKMASLESAVADLRRENQELRQQVSRLLLSLARACMVLLVRVGKLGVEEAEKLAREAVVGK
jgi:hypothetical protein